MAEETDARLHARIIAGDQAALAQWQERHVGSVMRMLLGRGLSLHDAEEVWNDAFLSTVKAAARLLPLGESMRRYVFKAALLQAATRFREEQKRVKAEPLEDTMQPVALADPSEQLSPMAQKLRACIDAAGERVRILANLLLSGADTLQIAAVLEVKRNSVAKLKERTLLALRRCIEGA